jgi:hypothetical protein
MLVLLVATPRAFLYADTRVSEEHTASIFRLTRQLVCVHKTNIARYVKPKQVTTNGNHYTDN